MAWLTKAAMAFMKLAAFAVMAIATLPLKRLFSKNNEHKVPGVVWDLFGLYFLHIGK